MRSYFDQSCGSIRPQLYSVLPCTLLWPYSNRVYLVLATAQKKTADGGVIVEFEVVKLCDFLVIIIFLLFFVL